MVDGTLDVVPDCNYKAIFGNGFCENHDNNYGYSGWADMTLDVYGSKSRCFDADFSASPNVPKEITTRCYVASCNED